MGDLRPGIPGILAFQGLAMAGVINRKVLKQLWGRGGGEAILSGALRVNPQVTERFTTLTSFTASLQLGPYPQIRKERSNSVTGQNREFRQ